MGAGLIRKTDLKPSSIPPLWMKKEEEMVLPWVTRIGYGVGHVFNDLCSALWFLYFLFFLGDIDKMSGQLGAITLLIGQIADAVATPVIGVWSDRGHLGVLSKIGKRRSWYLLGNIAVFCTIPFMFSPPINNISVPQEWLPAYLAGFVVIFQFGWAAVQTVHLALATDLTPLESERTLLLSLRNTFTSICTLAVPCIFLVIQKLTPGSEKQFMPQDGYKFQILVGVVVAIGVSCSLFAGFTMKETSDDNQDNERLAPVTCEQRRSYGQIFRQLDLYKVALLYTGTRLFGNILQTFVTLYISKTLRLPQDAVASVPLSVYSAATVSSIIAERLILLIGRKATYICGMIPGVCASIWMYVGPMSVNLTAFAYAVCSLYGAASSILLVTAISQTSVFIGMDIGNGAFVFGLMSFCDKLFCGLAILVIQSVKPHGVEYTSFYKNALAYTCGASAIVGTLAILSIFLPSRSGASNARETASNPDAVES